jgi:hypothetical protein
MAYSKEFINEVLKLHSQGRSNRSIAKELIGRSGAKSTIADILEREKLRRSLDLPPKNGAKILQFDIETAPTRVYVWGRFQQNVGQNQVISEHFVLTWAAKWLGNDKVMWDALDQYPDYDPATAYEDDYKVVKSLWDLLDEADIVVAHNAAFDTKVMNARFAYHGLPEPSPYKIVCTLKIAKAKFRFPSNKLDSLGEYLGVGRKVDTGGFELWAGCYAGDKKSFKKMTTYNIQDVQLLEDVYLKLRAWDARHPNVSTFYNDNKTRCVVCGSDDLETNIDSLAVTGISAFEVITCNNCGKHSRKRVNLKDKVKMQNTLTNIT